MGRVCDVRLVPFLVSSSAGKGKAPPLYCASFSFPFLAGSGDGGLMFHACPSPFRVEAASAGCLLYPPPAAPIISHRPWSLDHAALGGETTQ